MLSSIKHVFGRPWVQNAAASLAALAAIAQAWQLRWTSDDAFISFRYARAAALGDGLVFNPGERVEGMTNFLWTLFFIPAEALGANPEIVSWILGVLCYGGLLLLLRSAGLALTAFVAFTLFHHGHVFATSGLETSLFTLLVTAGLVCLDQKRERAGFLFLSLAILTRPDGVVFYAAGAVFAFWTARKEPGDGLIGRARRLIGAHAAFGLLLPVWILKSLYYGDILPNTFYAKSAVLAYPSQGLEYLRLFAASYWLLSLSALLFLVWPRTWAKAGLFAGACVLWLAYVLYVGGDFMYARFVVPAIPAAFILMNRVLRDSPAASRFFFLALALSLAFRPDPFAKSFLVGQISEEHQIYTRSGRKILASAARDLRDPLLFSGVRVGFVGAQAAFLYYWYPLYGIEAETGLTDRALARTPLNERGKIGHEKQASFAYLQSRRVHILLRPRPESFPAAPVVRMRGIPGDLTVIANDETVFNRLRASGVLEK